ncbi:proline dehydrogenase family protein [Parageobacillus thermoglucosidasius]|uniref:proline dehydrogenase family protein n=1 Tax=Parageobacillus thermoglucosidasius TaxID=1426 RepID=UPI000B577592|nr:proline dehydrogenase [Parageobacillus thermoglucosidasius]MBY6266801.1 proline dehydrogenase [Parageobacillus thermoglucosidasius]MED4905296.1 proline dehydrogenase [Parageobacillus thermoglucosidasius]MED4914213.1 proline dehydrogenase [Parageobacillus thermoglucosidasius]MED4945585.1 proline dehydrogenase [Parageobacillus thermoglucosidasius]MED4981424.1 proline dehydrogenase [Parageobacillus thermoglucosidasius]
MEQVMRNFFLFLSKNKPLTRLAKKYGLRFGASRFVAGETIEQAVEVIKQLNKKGLVVTVDYLGEFVDNEQEANDMADHCIEAIEAIHREKLDAQLSLKMTSMGLDISEELVMRNMRRILDTAKLHDVFVTIDMEDYSRYQKTLDIFKRLKTEYDNVGTVLQAYLYRTVSDIEDLKNYHPNLRLVKGAYKEPPEVAFPDKKDVDENFKKIIKMHLLNGNYTAVATHDDAIIEYTKRLVKEYNIPNSQFEFQMLYGIRPERQEQLAREGYTMRVYVPYGTDWYGYFMRRLAERPANVAFVLKGVLRK